MKEKIVKYLEYITEYSFYSLIFFTPISIAAIEISTTLIIISFYLKKTYKHDYKLLFKSFNLFLMLFYIFSGLSLFNSGSYLTKSLWALFFKWGKYLLIFIIAQDFFSNSRLIRNASVIFLFTGLLLGIDGIFQHTFGIDFIRHKSIMLRPEFSLIKVNAVRATFQHYNDFGAYLVIAISFIISLSLSERIKRIYRWILFFSGIVLGICLLLTLSRGSWLSFMAAIALMMFLSNKAKKIIPLTAIILIILFLAIPEFRMMGAFTFGPSGDMDRFKVWQTAFAMIKDHPILGQGIGTFMANFRKYMPNLIIQYAHNCFLQIWAETGIFSLLSFLGFLVLLFSEWIKAFNKNHNLLILGLLCGIFGFLVHSFFDTDLYSLQLSVLFWFTVGLTTAVAKLEKKLEI